MGRQGERWVTVSCWQICFFLLIKGGGERGKPQRTTTEGNSSGNGNGGLGTLQKLRLLLCHCYRSMSWSTSSKDLAMLGRLDSELPLLFLECPPESARDRNSVLNRTHTHDSFRCSRASKQEKKGKAKQKICSSSSHYLHPDSNNIPPLALPPAPRPRSLDLRGKTLQHPTSLQPSSFSQLSHPSCRFLSLLKDL